MLENKRGYKTSEFWVTLAQIAVSALVLFGVLDSSTAVEAGAVVGAGASVGGYAIGRGLAKRPPR